MKILLVNQNWLSGPLLDLGHEVLSINLVPNGGDVKLPRPFMTIHEVLDLLPFLPDRVVFYDNSGPMWILRLDENPIPSVFYSVDLHHHLSWHADLSALFDRVLVAQEEYIDAMLKWQRNVTWFPLWSLDTRPAALEPDIDVCFRGNLDPELHPNRATFFDALRKLVPVDCAAENYWQAYYRSKIVINEAVRGDLNFRVFEAMGCGAMLLTPRIGNGLLKLFTDGVDLVTYEAHNPEDAAAKIRYYLEHDDERQQIADSGYAEVLALHSSARRGKALADILEPLSLTQKPIKHYALARVHLATIAVLRKRSSLSMQPVLEDLVRVTALAAENREADEREIEHVLVMTKSYLDEAGMPSHELVKSVRAAYPTTPIINLLYLQSLLVRSEMELARAVAAEISEKPEELLASVPVLLREACAQVLTERTAP